MVERRTVVDNVVFDVAAKLKESKNTHDKVDDESGADGRPNNAVDALGRRVPQLVVNGEDLATNEQWLTRKQADVRFGGN